MMDCLNILGINRIKYFKFILYQDDWTGHNISYPAPEDPGLKSDEELDVYKRALSEKGIQIQRITDQRGANAWKENCPICHPRKEIG